MNIVAGTPNRRDNTESMVPVSTSSPHGNEPRDVLRCTDIPQVQRASFQEIIGCGSRCARLLLLIVRRLKPRILEEAAGTMFILEKCICSVFGPILVHVFDEGGSSY